MHRGPARPAAHLDPILPDKLSCIFACLRAIITEVARR
jgi:hypothetical protein